MRIQSTISGNYSKLVAALVLAAPLVVYITTTS